MRSRTRDRLARLVASGGGSGFFPRAPGTAGSLAALAAGAVILHRADRATLAAASLVAVGLGGASLRAIPDIAADPGWVVIDEVAGQWITMLALGPRPGPAALAGAFGLFRLLDIAKPGPVGWADRRPGAFGVMADDVIAGAIGCLVITVLRRGLALPGRRRRGGSAR